MHFLRPATPLLYPLPDLIQFGILAEFIYESLSLSLSVRQGRNIRDNHDNAQCNQLIRLFRHSVHPRIKDKEHPCLWGAWKIEFNAQYFVHFPPCSVVVAVVVVGVFAENAIHVFRCLRTSSEIYDFSEA